MIYLNDKLIETARFGDGTLKCDAPDPRDNNHNIFNIRWCYDDDSELFTLQCLVDYLRDMVSDAKINLHLPYIPNARQDRYVSGKVFSLKTFCKIINNMNFASVISYDPHSNVSEALLDRFNWRLPVPEIPADVEAVLYPDAGAAKKYQEIYGKYPAQPISKLPVIIGNKHRNTEGRIDRYDLLNFEENVKTILIRDDICSYGGTFVSAAKALKERGVEKIYLMVTHCEGNIFKGEVFDYIDKVITTDSILDLDHKDYEGYTQEKADKLSVEKLFRQ